VMTISGRCRSSTCKSSSRRALERCTIRFGQIGAAGLPSASDDVRKRSSISVSQASSSSLLRQFTVGKAPITPWRQAAATSSTPERGARVAFLTANRADSWCAGVVAQLSRLAITWLHPLGSLHDQLLKSHKGSAHAPKQIQFVKELPMTGVGKVDKKVQRATFWAGHDRMVG